MIQIIQLLLVSLHARINGQRTLRRVFRSGDCVMGPMFDRVYSFPSDGQI